MISTAPHRPFRIQPTRWFSSPGTLSDAGDALRSRLRILECAHDRRAAFCRAYMAHLTPVSRAVRDAGPHAAWVEGVAVALVRRYLAALAGWDRGDMSTTPEVWRAAFAIARHEGVRGDRALAASLAARLSFDAPLAIARAGFEITREGRTAFDTLIAIPWPGVPAHQVRDAGARAFDDAVALAEARDDTVRAREFTRIETGVLRIMRSLAAA